MALSMIVLLLALLIQMAKDETSFYYASRFASLIHRNEKFWTNCTPAAVKKIAILLPQRDIQLSGDTGLSWWDYPINNRLKSIFMVKGNRILG